MPSGRSGAIRKFFGSPKGLLTIVLTAFITLGAPFEGVRNVAPGLLIAVAAAGALDAIILRIREKKWVLPSGAILTAMITAMVLRSEERWYVTTITVVIGVASKYIFRSRTANVFNPAALAIVITFYIFHTGQSWWGALPELSPFGQVILVAGGVFITDRINKMPLALAFLVTYFLLFTATSFIGDPRGVSEIFRAPDLHAVLYFAFIILTDPPTSPAKYPDQLACGVIVAVVSYAVFEWAGVVYYLLAGVLAGNVWEAWRRVHRRTGYTFPRGAGTFLNELAPWNHSSLRR